MPPERMSYVGMVEAEERGRAMAERQVATNPEAKARVEKAFGVEYCQRRYPLAYQAEGEGAGTSLGA